MLTKKKLTLKNNPPFRSCISKINSTFIDNAEDLDIVKSMYNLLEYSDNYSMTSRSLWNYFRDEVIQHDNENNPAGNNRANNNKAVTSKSFEHKTKITEIKPDDGNVIDTEVVVPLKYLSNFCRSLYIPLINFEIELDLSCSKSCIISKISRAPEVLANPAANQPPDCVPSTQRTGATFQINSTKFPSNYFIYKR